MENNINRNPQKEYQQNIFLIINNYTLITKMLTFFLRDKRPKQE